MQEYEISKLTNNDSDINNIIENNLNSIYGENKVREVSRINMTYMITFSNEHIYSYNILKDIITDLTEKTDISKSEEENFVGYYADIDSDGEIDGIIFADLLVGSIKEKQQWGDENGIYKIPTVDAYELRNYYISKKNHEDVFGKRDVLSPKGSGKNRFYIMTLKDFSTSTYVDEKNDINSYPAYKSFYWYYNAVGIMSDYSNTTSSEFETGITNTETMIKKWNNEDYKEKDKRDVWKHIQTKYNEGWFIPSKQEWSAFANELGITSENYKTIFKLNNRYWSSSQRTASNIWFPDFYEEKIVGGVVRCLNSVRFATTF